MPVAEAGTAIQGNEVSTFGSETLTHQLSPLSLPPPVPARPLATAAAESAQSLRWAGTPERAKSWAAARPPASEEGKETASGAARSPLRGDSSPRTHCRNRAVLCHQAACLMTSWPQRDCERGNLARDGHGVAPWVPSHPGLQGLWATLSQGRCRTSTGHAGLAAESCYLLGVALCI